MRNINTIITQYQSLQNVAQQQLAISKCFAIANSSKSFGSYTLANVLFAYILHQRKHGAEVVKIGLEYLPMEEYDGYEYGEGNPINWKPSEISTERVHDKQYHLLVYLFTGQRDKPAQYLCVPAPMLSDAALRYAFAEAKKTGQGGAMPRRDHNRQIKDGLCPYNTRNIHHHIKGFQFPQWVFDPYVNEYLNHALAD